MARSTESLSAAHQLPATAADRLEQLRKECGFETLADFHAALQERGGYSVSYSSVSNYHDIRKNREPPASYFVRAAEVTGASLDWLLRGEGSMFVGSAPEMPGDELEPPLEQEGREAFWEELPDWTDLGFDAVSTLGSLLRAFLQASEALGTDDCRRFGADVAALIRFPYSRLGFRGPRGGRRYGQYVLAITAALLPMIPHGGAGYSGYPFARDPEEAKRE